MSRFLLVTADPKYDAHFRSAVEGRIPGDIQTVFDTALPSTPDELLGRSVGDFPTVVLLGPGVDLHEAMRLAGVFDIRRPEVSLVLVAPGDPGLAVAAMRSGFRDVLDLGADGDGILSLVTRAVNAAEFRRRAMPSVDGAYRDLTGPRDDSRVVVVTSPKGGVGKTTLATNLAVGLGRIAPMNTVIVDLDVQFGDVAAALRLAPEHSLTEAVTGPAVDDALVLKTFLTVHPASIYALCPPANPAEGELVGAAQVTRLIDQLSGQFQYVVIDTAPGMGEHALAALEAATDVVFVTGMDVPGVRGLRKQMDLLGELSLIPENVRVVVNAADRSTGLTVQDIEATIRTPVDYVIPRSRMAAYATNRGEPLLMHAPKDKAAKQLQALVASFNPDRPAPRRGIHRKALVSR
ncbi:AAA family ATPase [Kocuria rosea]|uniref:AAA family ATPase n=1 Tax=Kocuria rosea TaxID=1275 RepID=UPI00203E631D|nr:AAA family ATPase [Kocuria rosea]MCM3688702.1 AAA family ATPase [Kocuria rosea]